jgi:hypothetical protein
LSTKTMDRFAVVSGTFGPIASTSRAHGSIRSILCILSAEGPFGKR